MQNLFLIDGVSGTGKSDLVQFVANFQRGVELVSKYTTRQQRDYERNPNRLLDLSFVDSAGFDTLKLDYQYIYNRERYGFSRSSIESALSRSKNVFVVVRNADVICRIMAEYDFLNVVPVFVYTDEEKVRERLQIEGLSKEQTEFRLERINEALEDYVRHSGIYTEIIINVSAKAVFHQLIEQMLTRYKDTPEVEDDLIFILMSFDPKKPELVDYYEAMKRSIHNHDPSLRSIRLDELKGSFKISDTAKRKIQSCRLAIVDVTGNSPNVFYELGFAHGIKKDCIITGHKDSPRMFYPGEYKNIIYDSATELEQKLGAELKGVIGIKNADPFF
jgi:guanylate kinase